MRRHWFRAAAAALAIGLSANSGCAAAFGGNGSGGGDPGWRRAWDRPHNDDNIRDCYPLLRLWTAFGPQLHYVNVCSPRRYGYGYGFPSGYSYSIWGWGW